MNDEELKALEEKWMRRLRTGIYTERSWLAECVSDLIKVIKAFQQYRQEVRAEILEKEKPDGLA